MYRTAMVPSILSFRMDAHMSTIKVFTRAVLRIMHL
jgi:hypothetical protein